jgi:probable rRNA maturation factor
MVNVNLTKIHSFGFDELTLSKKIIREILSYEKIKSDISVNISIVGKSKIRTLNKVNRGIDKVTDVLSFPNIEFKRSGGFNQLIKDKSVFAEIYDFDSKSIFLGDVVICYDKTISQSKKYNHSVKREFSFLLTHSILHLLGYDHMKKSDEKIMFEIQDKILDKLKITR